MNSRGLTLIELLVTLSLLSVTMMIAFSIFSGGSRIWQRSQCESNQALEASVLFQDLRVHLRSYQAFSKLEFKGEPDQVTVPALVPSSRRNADGVMEPAQIIYYLKGDEGILCRATQPYRLIRKNRYKELACTQLMSGVEKMRFHYYGYNETSKDHQWRSSWDESLPLAIKVELTYNDKCSEDHVTQKQTITLPSGRVG